VSRGIGGLFEISAELDEDERGRGAGANLVEQAVATVPRGEAVVAAVAPGNTASLRAFLRAGFSPLGSVQVLRPARRS
jgi:L-amino acid N-acyltransferase YncA